MKRYIILTALLVLAANVLTAQTRPYNVVFDLAGKDTAEHRALVRWINEISNANAAAKMEVVLYAKGLDLVIKDKTMFGDAVEKMLLNKNLSIKVCAVAMKNQNIDKSQLLPGVEIVPDGIYEIISKQGEGWGYIKVAL